MNKNNHWREMSDQEQNDLQELADAIDAIMIKNITEAKPLSRWEVKHGQLSKQHLQAIKLVTMESPEVVRLIAQYVNKEVLQTLLYGKDRVISNWVIAHKDPTGFHDDVYYEGDYRNGKSKWGWFTDYAIHFDNYEKAFGFSKTIIDVECEPVEIKYQLHK